MEVRDMIEKINNIVEILQGTGCLFLAGAVGLAVALWRKRRAVLVLVLLAAGMELMSVKEVGAAVSDETPGMEEIHNVAITGFRKKDDCGWEEGERWLYHTEAEILLLLEESTDPEKDDSNHEAHENGKHPEDGRKDWRYNTEHWNDSTEYRKDNAQEYPAAEKPGVGTEKTEDDAEKPEDDAEKPEMIPENRESLNVQIWKQEAEWTSISQEEWAEYKIELVRESENSAVWYLRIGQEMRCRLLFWEGETCIQQQELVIDWTAPDASMGSVLGMESKKEPVVRNGVRYAGESLQVCMDIQDENGLKSVRCEGYADSGEKVFEEEWTGQDGYSCMVPLDFRGYLRWYAKDICENETVYESDSHFCTESQGTCSENSQIRMERCEEASDYCRESMVLRFYAASEWSGIEAIRIWEGDHLLLEEVMTAGQIMQWERILTVTPQFEGTVVLTVTLTSLTGQSVSLSQSWIKDVTAPRIRAEWEGKEYNGYFSTSGALCITVEETYFDPELWETEYECPDGKEENVRWDRSESGVYRCRIPFSEEGNYILHISGTDPAGNAMQYGAGGGSGSVSFTWTVDTGSPRIQINGVENAKHYGQVPDIILCMEEENPDYDRSVWRLMDEKTGQIINTGNCHMRETPVSFPQNPEDGVYRLQVEGYDLAGNYVQRNKSFTINQTGSSYQVKGLEGKSSFTAAPKLEITEANKSPITEYRIVYIWEGNVKILTEGEEYQVKKTEGIDYQNCYILPKELFQKEGYYHITVISRDAAGNSMSTQKNAYAYVPIRFSVDKTAPVVLLEEMKKKNGGMQGKTELQIQVMDNQNLKELHIRSNGKELLPGEDGTIQLDTEGADAVLQIEAEDTAGNTFYIEKKYQKKKEADTDQASSLQWTGKNGEGRVGRAAAVGIGLISLILLILFCFWKKKACIGHFPML